MSKKLRFCRDSFYDSPIPYTEFDIGGLRRYSIIRIEDKEKFLDAFAEGCRKIAEKCLEAEDDR